MIKVFAPAKINLCLHVVGQKLDGYHKLDSIVVHVDKGDWIFAEAADDLSLKLFGPFASSVPNNETNLVMRAARLIYTDLGASLSLEKNLPIASGIGGGSSDCVATLRALSNLWKAPLPNNEVLFKLGADVPVCLSTDLTRMQGAGEKLLRLGRPPILNLLLINPGVELSTPKVFEALKLKNNDPIIEDVPHLSTTETWIDWLSAQRNDLEQPAIALKPIIYEVLSHLRDHSTVKLARMSGSGATCFALFSEWKDAEDAEAYFQAKHPTWWIRAAKTWFPNTI